MVSVYYISALLNKCGKSIHMHTSYELLRIFKRKKLPTILVSPSGSNFLERNNFEARGEKNDSHFVHIIRKIAGSVTKELPIRTGIN